MDREIVDITSGKAKNDHEKNLKKEELTWETAEREANEKNLGLHFPQLIEANKDEESYILKFSIILARLI